MWFFGSKNKKDEERTRKILSGQKALMDAATTTATEAESVTKKLKNYLTDSIKQFEATIRILTDGLVVTDEKGNIQACNPSACVMFGSNNLIKSNIMNFVLINGHEANPETFWDEVNNDSDNINGKRGNNESFPIDINSVKLTKSDNSVIVLSLIKDMTKETDVQRKAEIFENRYNTLFNFLSDGILIVQNDKIVASNKAAAALFEKTQQELLMTELRSLVDIEHHNMVNNIDKINNEIEANSTKTDGTIMSLVFSSTSFIWNDLPANLITIKNLSKMKNMENTLKIQKHSCADMIVCFTTDFKITFVNEPFCKFYRIKKENVIGANFYTLINESEKSLINMSLNSLSKDNPQSKMQLSTKTKDGVKFQEWIDRAVFADDIIVEYQRIGKDVTNLFKIC